MRAGGGYKNRALSGQVLNRCEYLGAIKLIDVERTIHNRYWECCLGDSSTGVGIILRHNFLVNRLLD